MKLRSVALIGLSLVLSLVIAMLIRNHETAVSAAVPTAKIVAAKTQLNFGDRIAPASLQLMAYPPESVPDGAFSNIEDIAGPGEERVALRTMVPGEQVLASKISGNGGRATLSTVIDKGMRALTVAVNDVKGVAGFIQVSDRVDCFAHPRSLADRCAVAECQGARRRSAVRRQERQAGRRQGGHARGKMPRSSLSAAVSAASASPCATIRVPIL